MTRQTDSCYRHECETSRIANIKQGVQKRQGDFAHHVQMTKKEKQQDTPFGSRLRSILSEMAGVERLTDTQIKSTYGELLGVTSATGVANYLKRDRYPDVKDIITIARFVGCSLDWLLTGKDESSRINRAAFDLNQRMFIDYLVRQRGISFEEVVKELVGAGLDGWAREMAPTYRNMSEDELRNVLDAFFANAGQDTDGKRHRAHNRR